MFLILFIDYRFDQMAGNEAIKYYFCHVKCECFEERLKKSPSIDFYCFGK